MVKVGLHCLASYLVPYQLVLEPLAQQGDGVGRAFGSDNTNGVDMPFASVFLDPAILNRYVGDEFSLYSLPVLGAYAPGL